MDPLKEIRWKQRFENFEKSFRVLQKYVNQPIKTELERAGLIQLFEMTFELAWKVLKDYAEAEGYNVKSPRQAIKVAFQMELIDDGHIWLNALAHRNLTTHTYNEDLAEKLTKEIKETYFPEIGKLYKSLSEEK